MNQHSTRGFTLLEVLVMMIIIGITISFITLSIGGGKQTRELRAEAERLQGVLQLAREDAILLGRPLGLRVVDDIDGDQLRQGYEFAVYERGEWKALERHSVLVTHLLPVPVKLDMVLDGLSTSLFGDKASKKRDEDEDQDDEEKRKEALEEEKQQRFARFEPDIFFLQSGEFAPAFEMELRLDDSGELFTLAGNPLGQLELTHIEGKP